MLLFFVIINCSLTLDHYDILKKDEDNEENIERNGNLSSNGNVHCMYFMHAFSQFN